MAYQMAATAVTLNDLDLEGHLSVAGLFKCNPSNIAFYTISTESVLARFLCISRASCLEKCYQCDFPFKGLDNYPYIVFSPKSFPTILFWFSQPAAMLRSVLAIALLSIRPSVCLPVCPSHAGSLLSVKTDQRKMVLFPLTGITQCIWFLAI